MSTAAVRIVLVDSHDIYRIGVQHTLAERSDVDVVGTASAIESAGPVLAETRPQVVVLGLRLHEDHLLEQLPRLRRIAPSSRVLVLTRDVEERRTALLRAGASAALGKDLSGDKLAATVVALAEGRAAETPPSVAASLASRGEAHAARLTVAGGMAEDQRLARLTAQEHKILALIGEGMSNREIAERLYLAEKTVRNHVTRLLAKLGVTRRTQAAVIAVRAGSARLF